MEIVPDIVPDDKDWTWVLDRPCPECGLDTRQIEPASVAELLRSNSAKWVEVLIGTPEPARRPDPATWSTLEYACHVRDVFRLFDQRLLLMLAEENPPFSNWDQDETAVEERYGEQDPYTVAAQLHGAASQLAGHFQQVDGAQWQRSGRRSDGAEFTVASFSRYFIHDPIHHLYDVKRTT
jgi:hypothetical protein